MPAQMLAEDGSPESGSDDCDCWLRGKQKSRSDKRNGA